MKHTSLPRAFVRETTKKIKENFDLDKFVKKTVDKLNVPFFDECCDTAESKVYVPVRYNVTDEVLEYYDAVENEWVLIELS